ncbi:YggT family protein [Ectothiorhodospiraceae bacterium WFHF3C12]|nr:YggT family protein [Ectothiorhodospiraceae bacterium WFHF3C12]
MGSYLGDPLLFLIDTVFGLYIIAVMLRFILQMVRADFYNPISQFLVQITQPVLRPLRRVVPGFAGVDISSVVLMILLQAAALALMSLVAYGQVNPIYVLARTPVELVGLVFTVYIVAIIVMAVISWINPDRYNPVQTLLYSMTEPLMRPFRQIIPPIGGIDLSPLAAIIAIQVLKMLLMRPLNSAVPPII